MAQNEDCDIYRDDTGWLALSNFNSDNEKPAISEQ
jgi:hypothetical protein